LKLTTTVFRAHHPRWAWDPQSGEGAKLYGGHFNHIGQPALYTSSRLETAWLEAQQGFAFKGQPMTMCTYRRGREQGAGSPTRRNRHRNHGRLPAQAADQRPDPHVSPMS
jgi:RES domain-containing protein